MKKILISSVDINMGIGNKNDLLVRSSRDLRFFKSVTSSNCVVMGRKTYESIGKKLKNRLNIIVSSTLETVDGCIVVPTIQDAINESHKNGYQTVYFIGGESIFNESIKIADTLILTHINAEFDADRYFPKFNHKGWDIYVHDKFNENGIEFEIKYYTKKNVR